MHRRDGVPRGRFRRSMPLAGLTARTVCGRFVAGLRESAGVHGAVERFDQRAALRYAELLGRCRGVLMKAGQILSMGDTRGWGGGGLEQYLLALSRLQRGVPAMSLALVDELLRDEIGVGVGGFTEFVAEPVAAASIGQVHRGVISDGREVAVKVQYPGVARAIADDLANVELVATFLRWTASVTAVKADIGALARDAAARIAEEVDYCHEAATIAAFGELYRDHPFIRIPQVVAEASSERVLTMTYMDGLDWEQAQHADQDLKNSWAEAIIRFAYSNRRLAGLLHADPHPSNYRFFTDGTVGFLDFGCVQVLSEAQRDVWCALVRAAVEGRREDLRDLAAQVGFLDADQSLTAEEIYQWWTELLADILAESQPVCYTAAIRTRVFHGMFDFRDRHHPLARVSFPGAAAFIARIQFNLVSTCTMLGATVAVRSIADDTDGVAPPVTGMGRRHHDWMRDRGLVL